MDKTVESKKDEEKKVKKKATKKTTASNDKPKKSTQNKKNTTKKSSAKKVTPKVATTEMEEKKVSKLEERIAITRIKQDLLLEKDIENVEEVINEDKNKLEVQKEPKKKKKNTIEEEDYEEIEDKYETEKDVEVEEISQDFEEDELEESEDMYDNSEVDMMEDNEEIKQEDDSYEETYEEIKNIPKVKKTEKKKVKKSVKDTKGKKSSNKKEADKKPKKSLKKAKGIEETKKRKSQKKKTKKKSENKLLGITRFDYEIYKGTAYIAIAILVSMLIIGGIFFFINYNKMTLEKVKGILEKGMSLDNVYAEAIYTYSVNDGENTKATETQQIYWKDRILVSKFEEGVNWINYENSKSILVTFSPSDLNSKVIIVRKLTEEEAKEFNDYSYYFENLIEEEKYEYRYLQTKEYNGKKCVVVELYKIEDGYSSHMFWIDKKKGVVMKKEEYEPILTDEQRSKDPVMVVEYTYTYNTVSENDIKEPKREEYPDYKYYDIYEN